MRAAVPRVLPDRAMWYLSAVSNAGLYGLLQVIPLLFTLQLPTAAPIQPPPPWGAGPEFRLTAARVPNGVFPFSGARWRLDTFVSEPSEPDRDVVSIAPTVWWNDASDATVGIRLRSNYDGRYNRWMIWLNRGLHDVGSFGGSQAATLGESVDFRVRLENPTWMRGEGRTQAFEAWAQEGTSGARVAFGTVTPVGDRGENRSTFHLGWVATQELGFLDQRLWDNGGTVEAGYDRGWKRSSAGSRRSLALSGIVGWAYEPNRDVFSANRYTGDVFGRVTGEASVKRAAWGFDLGARLFGGVYLAADPPLKQRGIAVHGATPYGTLANPLVRTAGAPLVRPDLFYHTPGELNLRGYRPGLSGRWGLGVNLEVERPLYRRSAGVLRGVSLVGFWDGAVVDTLAVASFSGNVGRLILDGGAGVRGRFRIGDLTFPLRIEFPFYVSSPFAAHDRNRTVSRAWEFRWLVSLQPTF